MQIAADPQVEPSRPSTPTPSSSPTQSASGPVSPTTSTSTWMSTSSTKSSAPAPALVMKSQAHHGDFGTQERVVGRWTKAKTTSASVSSSGKSVRTTVAAMRAYTATLWRRVEFKYVKVAQVLCGIYILTVTFTFAGQLGVFGGARDPATGYIIDPNSTENTQNGIIEFTTPQGYKFTRAVVAESNAQMVLLALSRFSAFFMYPAIVLVFWSKFRSIQTFLADTPFGIFCISDTHRLHVYCGWAIFIDSCIHTIFHLARWALQQNLNLLWDSASGLTGFIVIVCTVIIVLPMTILKNVIKFEIRKYMHYLFWVFAFAMCFHAPFHALPNGGFCALIFPTLMFVYALDAFYAKAFMSERIQTVKYKTVKTGTQLTMKVSDRFVNRLHSGGYVYICFDWLDKHQWHAYSIYENPLDKSERHIFIANNGDWTESVHKKLKDRNTSRPVLISGPFPSPYTNAENYDNLILVAAGIGITPALSAIEAFRDSRRMNLVWATRDVSQLVFFLQNAKLDHKGFNLIFYTGSDPVPDSIEKQHSNANLSIIKSRPNLSNVLVNIISYFDRHDEYHSSDQSDMPDNGEFAVLMDVNDTSENESYEKKPIQPTTNLLNRTSALVSFANELGYDLSDLTEIVEKKLRPVSVSDNDHSGDVDVRSTQNLLDNDVESGTSMMNPANTLAQSIWEEDPESRQYVQSMSDDHLERWGLMYCGARNKLLETLIKESKDLNISFHDEAFDW